MGDALKDGPGIREGDPAFRVMNTISRLHARFPFTVTGLVTLSLVALGWTLGADIERASAWELRCAPTATHRPAVVEPGPGAVDGGIICRDGTVSTCGEPGPGCCSRHGGVAR